MRVNISCDEAQSPRQAWTHIVHGNGEDAGMVFEYRWANLRPGLELAGAQDRWLHLI